VAKVVECLPRKHKALNSVFKNKTKKNKMCSVNFCVLETIKLLKLAEHSKEAVAVFLTCGVHLFAFECLCLLGNEVPFSLLQE
jgi:hypothetical protein